MTEPEQASETHAAGPRRRAGSPARSMWLVALLLLGSAAALWGSSGLAWAAQRVDSPGGARLPEIVKGSMAVPALVPFAFLAVAALVALPATPNWARKAIGVLVAALGVVALVLAVRGVSTPHYLAAPSPTLSYAAAHAQIPFARGLGILAGLLELAAAVLIVARAPRLPRMGTKYSRRPAPIDPDKHLWESLSQGADPTAPTGGAQPRPESGDGDSGVAR
ncbi:MAG: Trp biosynthesis-associated membrane protein [Sciscionella sp.]